MTSNDCMASRSGRATADSRVGAMSRASATTAMRSRRRRADPGGDADATVRTRASRSPAGGTGNALPFIQARGPFGLGMVMFTEPTAATTSSRASSEMALDRPVFDLDVEHTHNFIAGGLVTHNSVYGFSGADIKNILNFQDDFVDAHVVKLEQNYRSTQTILSAANAVVANNRGRMDKALWTEIGEGDPSRCGSSPTSMRRPGTSRPRSSGWSTRASRGRRSRSSTGPTRSRGCSRTCWCGRRSATRSSAARSSMSGRRSGTPSRTSRSSPTRRTRGRSRAWPTRPSAGSARPRSRGCSRTRTRWACRCGTRRRSPRACPGSGRRRARRSGASCRRWCGCASAPRARRRWATCWTSCCARRATSTRSRPSGRSRRRGGWRTSRSSCGSRASTTRWPSRAPSASSCSRSR